MGFALLAYSNNAVGVNAVNTDLTAATDPDFTARNGHYTFTEDYRIAALTLIGASVTRGRFQCPTYNALGELAILVANRSATVPSNPFVEMLVQRPLFIPKNEEFQVQVSGNLGAATETDTAFLWVITNDWSANLPQEATPPFGISYRYRATVTITPTVNAWSGPNAITLSQSIRNGVWAIIGGVVQGTNALAYRWVFPKYRLYQGRKLRPGNLVQNAAGDVPAFNFWQDTRFLGEWGRFHTFELPQIEVWGQAAVSTTYQIFMDMVYLGTDINLLNQGLGGGMGPTAGY